MGVHLRRVEGGVWREEDEGQGKQEGRRNGGGGGGGGGRKERENRSEKMSNDIMCIYM